MDKSNLPVAAKGLMLLFVSCIVNLFSSMQALALVVRIVAGVISLYGLYIMSDCHPRFRTALIAGIVGLVCNTLSNIPLLALLSVVGSIAVYASDFMICTTIDEINVSFGVPQSPEGTLVWKMRLAALVMVILGIFMIQLLVIGAIVAIISLVFYMMLLYKSSKALEALA